MGSFGEIMIVHWKQQAYDHPDRVWIRSKDQEITYGDLAKNIKYYADHLQQKITSGSRVGIWKQDIITTITLFFAILEIDCTVVLFSDRDPPEKIDLQSKYILLDHMIQDPLPVPSDFLHRIPSDKDRFCDPHNQKIILFTSGSTHTPKAVLHSLHTLQQNAIASHKNIPFQHGDTWLLSLSLWHVGGLAIVIRSMLHGGTIALGSIDDIISLSVTHVSFVSLQLQQFIDFCQQQEKIPPKIRHCLVGGGPTHQKLILQAFEMGIPLHRTYGMTELGSQMSTTPIHATSEQLCSSGIPLEGWDIRFSKTGEIQIKGSALFLGYVEGNNIQTCRDQDGYFSTGDCGYIKKKLLFIEGRQDQMFISGGENIHPENIEQALMKIDGILYCIVVDLPHPKYGARPIAILNRDAHIHICDKNIRNFLLNHLPKFAIPDHTIPWPTDYPSPIQSKPSRSFLRQYAQMYMQTQSYIP